MKLFDISQVSEGFYASRIETCPGVNHFIPLEHIKKNEMSTYRTYFCVHCDSHHTMHSEEYNLRARWDKSRGMPMFNAFIPAKQQSTLYAASNPKQLKGVQAVARELYMRAASTYRIMIKELCHDHMVFPVEYKTQYVHVFCITSHHQHHIPVKHYQQFAEKAQNPFNKRGAAGKHLEFVKEAFGENSFYYLRFTALLNTHATPPHVMSEHHAKDMREVEKRNHTPSVKLTNNTVKRGKFAIRDFILPVEYVPEDLLYEFYVCGRKAKACSLEEAALIAPDKNPYKCEICPDYHVGSLSRTPRSRAQRVSSSRRTYARNPIRANRFIHAVMMGSYDY